MASQELEWWAWWTLIDSFSDLFALWIQTEIGLFCSDCWLYAAYSCCLSSDIVYWWHMRNDKQQWKANFSATQVKPNTQNVTVMSSDKSRFFFSYCVANPSVHAYVHELHMHIFCQLHGKIIEGAAWFSCFRPITRKQEMLQFEVICLTVLNPISVVSPSP